MRVRSVAMAAVCVAVAVTGCSSSKHATPPATSTASAAPGATTAPAGGGPTEAQLRSDIQNHGLTPKRAAELFSIDIGQLPGVSVEGVTPDAYNFDGTDAVGDVYAEWTKLTRAQRDEVTRLLEPIKSVHGAATRAAHSGPVHNAVTLVARSGPGTSPATRPATLVDAPAESDLLSYAQTANVQIHDALKGPGFIPGFVFDYASSAKVVYAETRYYSTDSDGTPHPWPNGCHIEIFDNHFDTSIDTDSAQAIVAHEVFHCYMQRAVGLSGKTQNWLSIHDWVGEGAATWVMAQLHPHASIINDAWQIYTSTPTKKYFDRNYDGVGLFGHLGDVLGDQTAVWGHLIQVNADAVNGEDSKAWKGLIAGVSDHYYETRGASYYETHDGPDWFMGGPGTPPSGASPRSVNIGPGDGQEIGLLDSYQAAQTDITGNADVLVITLSSGYGKAHDADFGVDKPLDTMAPLGLCLKEGGCKCPDGSPGASERTIPAKGPISVGLDAGDQSLAAYAAGASLDDFCKKPDPTPPGPGGPPPPPGHGGGGGGGPEPDNPDPQNGTTQGDPHITTFDGKVYDLQTVGEMTLVKSTTDDFAVQVRTAAVPGRQSVSFNIAAATRLDGHRLTFAEENGALQARLDGNLVIDEVTKVGKGSLQRLITTSGNGFVAEWPDGTKMRVSPYVLAAISVQVVPAAARKGKLVGLLGNDNGRADDDFATADGRSLGAGPTPDVLNKAFTDSWRVAAATSLLPYGPGQTTATFTDTTFPRAVVNAGNAPNHAEAEQQCKAAAITDKYLLQQCIVDVSALPQQPAVLTRYTHAQTLRTTHDALARGVVPFGPSTPASPGSTTPTTEAGGGPWLRTVVDVGRVNAPGETSTFSFPGHAGDVIFVGPPPVCDDGGLTFALKDPNGAVLNQFNVDNGLTGCQTGRGPLKTDGDYTFVANANRQRALGYTVPIHWGRPDVVRQASYGQLVSGNIPDKTAHDVYTFDARAGDSIHIDGPDCDIGTGNNQMDLNVAKADGTRLFELDCTPGGFPVQTAGRYEVTVNDIDHGPGSYRFRLQK